jgi:hypothetical protein
MKADFRGPAARRFDWQHIFDRHSEKGIIAHQSGKKTVFVGLTEAQIRARVKAAWRKRKRIRSQVDLLGIERVLYRGTATRDREVIEFWYNQETKTVETAYPVGA